MLVKKILMIYHQFKITDDSAFLSIFHSGFAPECFKALEIPVKYCFVLNSKKLNFNSWIFFFLTKSRRLKSCFCWFPYQESFKQHADFLH